jgi:paraquat-inducible protein B
MISVENTTREDSSLIVNLTEALQELSRAARSLRALADYLDQHPEALLRGKGGSGGE